MGSCAGCSGMNPKRRRMAVSTRAIERSADHLEVSRIQKTQT